MKKLSMIGLLASCVILGFSLVSKVSAEAAKSIVIEDFENPERAQKEWSAECGAKSTKAKVSFKVDQPGANGTANCGLLKGYVDWWARMVHGLKPEENISGLNCMTFWVCGSMPSQTLGLDFTERDGSRWTGSLGISDKWEKVTITAKNLSCDKSCSQKSGRGFEGDWVDFGNLDHFSFGLIPRPYGGETVPGEWYLKIDEIRMETIQSIGFRR